MTLRDLEAHFADRHIGPDADEQAAMLDALGLASLDELADRTVPASIRDRDPLDLPPAGDETLVLDELRALADRNTVLVSLLGGGIRRHHHPAGDPAQRVGEPRLVHRVHARTSPRSPRAASKRS